jgi:8-oxo-dGTP diphosphatase
MRKSAGAFVYYKDSILLFHRDDKPSIPFPDHWDIIGGVVDTIVDPKTGESREETFEETLRREMVEEIGINPSNLKFIGTYDRSKFEGQNILSAYYSVELTDDEFAKVKFGKKEEDEEGQEVKAVPLEDLDLYKIVPLAKCLLNKEIEFEDGEGKPIDFVEGKEGTITSLA